MAMRVRSLKRQRSGMNVHLWLTKDLPNSEKLMSELSTAVRARILSGDSRRTSSFRIPDPHRGGCDGNGQDHGHSGGGQRKPGCGLRDSWFPTAIGPCKLPHFLTSSSPCDLAPGTVICSRVAGSAISANFLRDETASIRTSALPCPGGPSVGA